MNNFAKAVLVSIVLFVLVVIFGIKLGARNEEIRTVKNMLGEAYTDQSGYLDQIRTLEEVLSGYQNTATQEIETGEIVEEFTGVVLRYPNQPTTPAGSYEGNTQALNNYSARTRQSAELTQDFKGEIVVHLRKTPTIHTVMYFKTDGIYCGGRLNAPINENNDFVLSMDGFKIGKVNCILRNSDGSLPEKIYIGGYVANFDGNGIETVTIK